MANEEKRTIVGNLAEDEVDGHRVLSGNRGGGIRPISYLFTALVIAAIVALVYFTGGFGDL